MNKEIFQNQEERKVHEMQNQQDLRLYDHASRTERISWNQPETSGFYFQ